MKKKFFFSLLLASSLRVRTKCMAVNKCMKLYRSNHFLVLADGARQNTSSDHTNLYLTTHLRFFCVRQEGKKTK